MAPVWTVVAASGGGRGSGGRCGEHGVELGSSVAERVTEDGVRLVPGEGEVEIGAGGADAGAGGGDDPAVLVNDR